MHLNELCVYTEELGDECFHIQWFYYLILSIPLMLELLIMFLMVYRRGKDGDEEKSKIFVNGCLKIPNANLAISLSLVGMVDQSMKRFYNNPSISLIIISARASALLLIYPFWKMMRKSDLSVGEYIYKRFPKCIFNRFLLIFVFLSSVYNILVCRDAFISSTNALSFDDCAIMILFTLFSSLLYKHGGIKTVCWTAVFRLIFILIGKLAFVINGFGVLSGEEITFFRQNQPLVFHEFESFIRDFIHSLSRYVIILFSNHGGLHFFNSTNSGKDALLVVIFSILPFAAITIMNDISGHIVYTYYESKDLIPGGHSNAAICLSLYFFLLDTSTNNLIYVLTALSDLLLGTFQIIISIQAMWIELIQISGKWKCLRTKDMYELRNKGMVFLGISVSICLTILLNKTLTGFNASGIFHIVNKVMLLMTTTLIWFAGIFPHISNNTVLPTIICGSIGTAWLIFYEKDTAIPYDGCQREEGIKSRGNDTFFSKSNVYSNDPVLFYTCLATIGAQIISIILVTKLCKRRGKATDDDLYVEMAITYWTNYYIKRKLRAKNKKQSCFSKISKISTCCTTSKDTAISRKQQISDDDEGS